MIAGSNPVGATNLRKRYKQGTAFGWSLFVCANLYIRVSMARTSPKIGLTVWTDLTDPYDHDQLADNWLKVDQHDHSEGRGVQVSTNGIFDGAITGEKLDPDLLARIPTTDVATVVPSGVIMGYAGPTAPTGWLICDGTAVSRTTYSNLFGIIGTTYGVGDGSSTFNLPNSQNKVLLGVSTTKTRGSQGGEETHVLASGEGPDYGGTKGADVITSTGNVYVFGSNPGTGTPGAPVPVTIGLNSTKVAGGTAHNNLQPYLAVFQIIKV